MKHLSWLIPLLVLAAGLWLYDPIANANVAGSTTLNTGQTLNIRANGCKLKVKIETPTLVKVVCKPLTASSSPSDEASQPAVPNARVTLGPGERQRVKSNQCNLNILKKTASIVKVTCVAIVTPTSTPTQTASSTPTSTPTAGTLFETALSLDGIDDYASAPDASSLDLGTGSTDDFTIETFFYVPNLNNDTTDTLVWKQGAYGLYVISSSTTQDRIIYRIYTDPVNYVYLIHFVDLSVGWHHVAAVYDNEYTDSQDLLALYLDGSQVSVGTNVEWTPGVPNSSSSLYIGGYATVNPAIGWMEETRFSNSVRYNNINYTLPSSPFSNDANTRALWHFDDQTGSTTFGDSSGNSNPLIGVNGARTGNP